MKLKRINRMFLAFLLASGLQLSLSTCTREGMVMANEKETYEDIIVDNDIEETSLDAAGYKR